ncbi:MAG: PAAR domain-containing protein [Gammaproteobacteria bacterium]|nr:PAAR domain-containing protein [Gammaproteobacteria bacterium]
MASLLSPGAYIGAQGLPAARVTDALTAPVGAGGTIQPPGAPSVLIQGLPAARVTDLATCAQAIGPAFPVTALPITSGSTTVLIGSLGAARITDATAHPCSIAGPGSPTVLIGD